MTSSRGVFLFVWLLGLGCSDGGAAGSAGISGGGGIGGEAGPAFMDLRVLPCALRTPVVSEPGNEACENGCTRVVGDNGDGSDGILFFVACVQNESLESEALDPDINVCMTSPVEGVDYTVPSPLFAQAVAQVCWVPCFVSGPLDPAFEEWIEEDVTFGTGLHIGFDIWLERCGDAWSL